MSEAVQAMISSRPGLAGQLETLAMRMEWEGVGMGPEVCADWAKTVRRAANELEKLTEIARSAEERVLQLEAERAGKVLFTPGITKRDGYYSARTNANHVRVGFGKTPEEAIASLQGRIEPLPAAPQENGGITGAETTGSDN